MQDILTITLNPALDLSTGTDQVQAGPKLRCDAPLRDPGGGGINVARAVHILGGRARAFVALGGATGVALAGLLGDAGIETVIFDAPGETRISLAVSDRATGGQYRFVMPGPVWTDADQQAVLAAIIAALPPRAGLVVLSGSLPPGVSAEFPALLAARLNDSGARLVADTSGPALHRLAGVQGPAPFVLRMDGEEAEDLAGHALPRIEDSAAFAADLVARGAAQVVIVARGADGSVLATQGLRLHAAAADVPVRSKVGAGDSFVGAFALGLARGLDLGAALQRGVAAASAAVMTEATQLCTRADAEALVAQSALTLLPGE